MKATLYMSKACPHCARLLEQFHAREVVVEVLDVTEQPQLVPELLKLTGGRRVVPVLVESGRIRVAPDGGSQF